jgi:hypothetical protein
LTLERKDAAANIKDHEAIINNTNERIEYDQNLET